MKTEKEILQMGALPAPDGLPCTGRAEGSVLPQAPLWAQDLMALSSRCVVAKGGPQVTPVRLVTPHPGDAAVALKSLSHPEPIT